MFNKPIAIFGEVLFDHFPERQVLGGAPFNVAWHLEAFGAQPCFISRVGQDAEGAKVKQAMQTWGLATANLQSDNQYPTGTVKVVMQQGEPHYEIVAAQAYDEIAAAELDPEAAYSWLYHGSLALRNSTSRQALEHLLTNHQGQVFVDVNLRAPWWDLASLHILLERADWVKLNESELQQIFPEIQEEISVLMQICARRFNLQGLVVTCGAAGAMLLSNDELLSVTPETQVTVVDTVGAGDAFSAIMLLGLAHQWPLPLSLNRAQQFASAVVGQRGGTVSDKSFYAAFINSWQLALPRREKI